MKSIPESDWKKLSAVRPLALNRLCARILSAVEEKCHLGKSGPSPHQEYLQAYRLVQDSDSIVADLFDDWRRSTVLLTLMKWLEKGLLTRGEFEVLSEETKASVSALVQPKFFAD